MMYIEIQDPSADDLHRDVYRFIVNVDYPANSRITVRLDYFAHVMRPSKRHRNWQTTSSWGRRTTLRASETERTEEPIVPAHVHAKVQHALLERIDFNFTKARP